MQIKVLGTGCANCKTTFKLIEDMAKEKGVAVEMEKQSPALQDMFVRSMDKEPDVMSCYEISGDYDYMLLVHARDMADYHHFTRRALTADNNVRGFKSQFVMNFNKVETKITL